MSTKNYTYSNGKLTSYGGMPIYYDSMGNISTYYYAFTWERGHLLKSLTDRMYFDINFEYNAQGLRTRKNDLYNQKDHKYIYDGDKLVREVITELTLNPHNPTETRDIVVNYYYDASGVCGFSYDGVNYFYKKNILGDVVEIYDDAGLPVGLYAYDAFGNCTITEDYNGIATLNPFRYRGYYYDTESGLYYLKSRYYSPELCRFISPDSIDYLDPQSINGLNLYAYTNNNPIKISKSANRTYAMLLTHIEPSLNKFTSNISAGGKNYWNPHWGNKWFDTDCPGFFVLSKEGFEIINWSLSIYKGNLYFDNNENHSLYVSAGNVNVYAGINYKKGIGIDVGASALEIGYDSRIVDANVEFLTIGITYMYKDGKFEFGVGAGWWGWSVSIDFVELFKLLFGGE